TAPTENSWPRRARTGPFGSGTPPRASRCACCRGVAGPIRQVVFHPDGRRLASVTTSALTLWDVVTGEQVRALYARPGGLRRILCSPAGQWLVFRTRARDATGESPEGEDCLLWDLTHNVLRDSGVPVHAHDVNFSPDGRRLAWVAMQ